MDHDLGKLIYEFRANRQVFLQDLQQMESDVASAVARMQQKFQQIGGMGRSGGLGGMQNTPAAGGSSLGGGLLGGIVASAIDTNNANNIVNAVKQISVSSGVSTQKMLISTPQYLNASPGSMYPTSIPAQMINMGRDQTGVYTMKSVSKLNASVGRENTFNDAGYLSKEERQGIAADVRKEWFAEAGNGGQISSGAEAIKRRSNRIMGGPGAAGINDPFSFSEVALGSGNVGSGNGGQFNNAFGGDGGNLTPGNGGQFNNPFGPAGGGSGGSNIWAQYAKKLTPLVVAYMALKTAEVAATGPADIAAAGSNPYAQQMARNNIGRSILGSIPIVGGTLANIAYHSEDIRAGFQESDRVQQLNYNNAQLQMPALSGNAKAAAFGGLSIASAYAGSVNNAKGKIADLNAKISAQEFENRTKNIDLNGRIDEQLSVRGIKVPMKDGENIQQYDARLREIAKNYNFDLYHQTISPLVFQKEYAQGQSENEKKLILNKATADISTVNANNQGAALANRLMPYSGLAAANVGTAKAQYALFKSQINAPGMDDAARAKETELMGANISSSILSLQAAQTQLGLNLGYGRPTEFNPQYQSIEANRDISPETTAVAMVALTNAIEENNKLLADLKGIR